MSQGCRLCAPKGSAGSALRARWGLVLELSTGLSQRVPKLGTWIAEPSLDRFRVPGHKLPIKELCAAPLMEAPNCIMGYGAFAF